MTKTCTGRGALLAIGLLFAGGILSFAGPVELSKDKIVQQAPTVCDPVWYISVGGNGEFNTDATNLQNASAIAPTGVRIGEISTHDFNDAYDVAFYSVEAEVGRVLTDHVEVFGQFQYVASATQNLIRDAVRINVGGPTPAFLAIRFDDYTSYGFQVGARYFFIPKGALLRPYVSIAGGAAHVDSIGVETALEPTNTIVSRSRIFDDSWVGTVTGLIGLEYSVSCHLAVGINAGVGYSSPLSEDDTDLQGPVSKVNNEAGDRVYCPVAVYAKIRF